MGGAAGGPGPALGRGPAQGAGGDAGIQRARGAGPFGRASGGAGVARPNYDGRGGLHVIVPLGQAQQNAQGMANYPGPRKRPPANAGWEAEAQPMAEQSREWIRAHKAAAKAPGGNPENKEANKEREATKAAAEIVPMSEKAPSPFHRTETPGTSSQATATS